VSAPAPARAAAAPPRSATAAAPAAAAPARPAAAVSATAPAAVTLAPGSSIAATLAPSDPRAAPAPGAAGEVTEAERDRYAAVLEQIASHDGGPCFAALPALGEITGDLTLDAFAVTPEELDSFRADLEENAGIVPLSVFLPITERQCPALAFLRSAADYPGFSIYFDLGDRDIESGALVEGRILNTGTDHVSLLAIDNEGLVQNATHLLTVGNGSAAFAMNIFRRRDAVETKQLLLAIATPGPLPVVEDFDEYPADIFFTALDAELRSLGYTADAAMIGITVR
jgi:hypothetical protein